MPKVSRSHHYVTSSYLARFTHEGTREGHFFETDVVKRQVRPARPGNVAVERDFHRVDLPGMPSDFFEKSLRQIEDPAVNAIRSICRQEQLSDQECACVLNLVALITVSNPSMRESMRTARAYETLVVADLQTSTPERFAAAVAAAKRSGHIAADAKPSYEAVREAVEKRQFRVSVSSHESLRMEVPAAENALQSFLTTRWWSLLTAAEDAPDFVTSDHPVGIVFTDPTARGYLGYETPGTEISFPLDPRHALIGVQHGHAPQLIRATASEVGSINSRTVYYARRSIFSRSREVVVYRGSGLSPYLTEPGSA